MTLLFTKLHIRKYFIAIPWETEGHDSRCCRTLVSSIELFWSELFVNHQRIDAALMGFWGDQLQQSKCNSMYPEQGRRNRGAGWGRVHCQIWADTFSLFQWGVCQPHYYLPPTPPSSPDFQTFLRACRIASQMLICILTDFRLSYRLLCYL